ncbi:hypothetical protein [Lichenifustis flavocetrariae]|uniref:Uncharacterized protein n=1 Tax=Lichenifustis flavocetrariae TaxID=2949735 RepID=A0AA41YZ95_9HYPH|nr:hypothetical protein [Lichenifustis flavocetrariae]MCW6509967.1 hypothetical protein [Lichenifustis flavocetrariae]
MHVHMKPVLPQQPTAPPREPPKPAAATAAYGSEVQRVSERRNGAPGRGSQGRSRPQRPPEADSSGDVIQDPAATLAKTLAALDLGLDAVPQEPDRPDAPSLDDLLLGALPAGER